MPKVAHPDLRLPFVSRHVLELEQAEALRRLRAYDGCAALLAQEQQRSAALREQLAHHEAVESGLRTLLGDQEQVLAQRNRAVAALHEEIRLLGGKRRLHLAEPLHIADVLQDWSEEMLGRGDDQGTAS